MSKLFLSIYLSFAMAFMPALAVAAKAKADFKKDGPVFVRQLLKELPIHKEKVSKKKMLNFFLDKQSKEFHMGAKKFFKGLPIKNFPKYNVDRVKLPSGQETYKVSFKYKKKFVSMELIFGPKVYARVNGNDITNKDMMIDAGRSAMMRALGVNPARQLFPAKVLNVLTKGERALYVYHLRRVVMAIDGIEKANQKAYKASIDRNKDVYALLKLILGEEAHADGYANQPCVNGGHVSSYPSSAPFSCPIPEGMSCNSGAGIQCNPIIFGRRDGANICVTADNNASTTCDQQFPLTEPRNVREVIESQGNEYNAASVNALNSAIQNAIAACNNPPANQLEDQVQACRVLQSRYGDFVAIQEDIVADLDEGPNTIGPVEENGPGFGERAGNWMRDNKSWLIPVGIGVAGLALILLMRNRNKGGGGGDDPDPTPTPGETPVGKPGEPETERWAGTGTLRVRSAAYAGWSTDEIGSMMRSNGDSGRPGVRSFTPVDI